MAHDAHQLAARLSRFFATRPARKSLEKISQRRHHGFVGRFVARRELDLRELGRVAWSGCGSESLVDFAAAETGTQAQPVNGGWSELLAGYLSVPLRNLGSI